MVEHAGVAFPTPSDLKHGAGAERDSVICIAIQALEGETRLVQTGPLYSYQLASTDDCEPVQARERDVPGSEDQWLH